MMGFLQVEGARRYLEALEEEKKKIQVFQRELPLCCDLVAQAIASYRQQMVCDEETSSDVPVLEEFIPIKRSRSLEEEEGEEESSKDVKSGGCGDDEQHQEDKKPDWLQSVQLWNQNPDPPKEEAKFQKPVALEAKKVKGAFHPFHRDQKNTVPVAEPPPPPPPAAASSTGDTGGSGGGGHEKEGHSNRKARRCWSPELHRRFLHALQQLGGSHAATPKQIRELMKVDGLTNDEVKSHLQKYRLHTRRPSPSAPTCSGGSTQTPQFILVGGIWVPPPPPPEYAVAAAMSQPVTENSAAATSRIYAPVASVPMGLKCGNNNKNSNSSSNNSGEGDRANSNSPATSSSSLTVTTSPCLWKDQ